MARMRRIQIVMDPDLDDRLEQEAAARGLSKSALVRELVGRGLLPAGDNGLLALLELSKEMPDVEPADVDTVVYGLLEAES